MKPERHGARIILLNSDDRFLMFRFSYHRGPLAGLEYWGVPGGGVEPDESAAQAAVRELREETGLTVDSVGQQLAESGYDFRLSSGSEVWERDHYFLLRFSEHLDLSRDGFTQEETESLVEHRWWSIAEVRVSTENIIPGNLESILEKMGLR